MWLHFPSVSCRQASAGRKVEGKFRGYLIRVWANGGEVGFEPESYPCGHRALSFRGWPSERVSLAAWGRPTRQPPHGSRRQAVPPIVSNLIGPIAALTSCQYRLIPLFHRIDGSC